MDAIMSKREPSMRSELNAVKYLFCNRGSKAEFVGGGAGVNDLAYHVFCSFAVEYRCLLCCVTRLFSQKFSDCIAASATYRKGHRLYELQSNCYAPFPLATISSHVSCPAQ